MINYFNTVSRNLDHICGSKSTLYETNREKSDKCARVSAAQMFGVPLPLTMYLDYIPRVTHPDRRR